MLRKPPDVGSIPRVLPRGRHKLAHSVVVASQRNRLLEAMVELTADKGFAAVTIADIVSHAGTAKRTFYDHFSSKLECFLAAFDEGTANLIRTIAQLFRTEGSIHHRAEVAVRGYLEALAKTPAYARTYMVEVLAAGPEAIARRLELHREYARMIVQLAREARSTRPDMLGVTEAHALAVIGAVHERIYRAIHEHGAERLLEIADELAPLAAALLSAKVHPPAAGRTPTRRRAATARARTARTR